MRILSGLALIHLLRLLITPWGHDCAIDGDWKPEIVPSNMTAHMIRRIATVSESLSAAGLEFKV